MNACQFDLEKAMTTLAHTTAGALRRAAECVLMAFGVPVTRDMPADAVFLSMREGGDAIAAPPDFNPANGNFMLDSVFDMQGNLYGDDRHRRWQDQDLS